MDLSNYRIYRPISKILCVRIPVGSMPSKDVPQYLQQVAMGMPYNDLPKHVTRYLIPCRDIQSATIEVIDLEDGDDELMSEDDIKVVELGAEELAGFNLQAGRSLRGGLRQRLARFFRRIGLLGDWGRG